MDLYHIFFSDTTDNNIRSLKGCLCNYIVCMSVVADGCPTNDIL